jgi:hypothetical protein
VLTASAIIREYPASDAADVRRSPWLRMPIALASVVQATEKVRQVPSRPGRRSTLPIPNV